MSETTEKKEAMFNVVGQYAKDISFECPIPAFAKEAENVSIGMDVQLGTRSVTEGVYETVIRLKIEAKNPEDVSCYLAEVDYVGVYQIEGLEGEQLDVVLNVDGAAIVYPFARQVIMGLIVDAGYRAPQLAPINFMAMFQDSKQKKEQQAS